MSCTVLTLGGVCALLSLVAAQVGDVDVVGANVLSYKAYGGPLSGAQKVFLMKSEKYLFKERSVIFAFIMFVKNTNPFKAQVYRPRDLSLNEYELVWEYHVTPQDSDLNRRAVINVTNDDCFMVQNGDRLAFLNQEVETSIAHEFQVDDDEAALFFDLMDFPEYPKIGEKRKFDTLGLPYAFQLAAAVDKDTGHYGNDVTCRAGLVVPGEPAPTTTPSPDVQGPKGDQGEKGEQGARGPTGAKGDTGPQGSAGNDGQRGLKGDMGELGPKGVVGPKGEAGQDGLSLKGDKGAPGAQGPAGPPGQQGEPGERGPAGGVLAASSSDDECECGEGLLQKGVILGLIVWLLILTLLIIMLIVLLTVRRKEFTSRDSMRESAAWVHTTEPWAGKDPYVVDTMSR